MPVFHLTTPDAWATAAASGLVTPPSLAEEGFIHCSTDEQLAGTIARHFAGVDELRLLELDPALDEELRWEESRPGQVYPHLDRPLAVAEVVQVVTWRRGERVSRPDAAPVPPSPPRSAGAPPRRRRRPRRPRPPDQ